MNNVIRNIVFDTVKGHYPDSSREPEAQPMRNFTAAPKKSTSVSLAEPLLAEARALGVNVSQAAEDGLARAVSARRAELWIQENQEAIHSSNTYVEQHGLPLARYRMF